MNPHLNIEMAKVYQHELEARAAQAQHIEALRSSAPRGPRASRLRSVRVTLTAAFAKPLRLVARPATRS